MGILIFILILAVLVLSHELGHFLSARIFKVKVDEFGIGFPPRIFAKKRGETTYSVNALPLGGFVKLYGEDGEHKSDQGSFSHKPIWQRTIILISGVFMNFVIALIILSLLFTLGMPSLVTSQNKNYIKNYELKITEVGKNTPASLVGIKIGDQIFGVTYENMGMLQTQIFHNLNVEQFQKVVKDHAGKDIGVVLTRNGHAMDLGVIPRINTPENEGPLGVGLMEAAIVAFPWYISVYEAPKSLINGAGQIITAIYQNIKAMIVKTEKPEITGPVGIAVISAKTYQLGWKYLGSFVSVLSLNLAVLNLLPLPALDGGRLLFLLIEKLRRKPVSQKIEMAVNNMGFAFLLLLILLITIKDIKSLI